MLESRCEEDGVGGGSECCGGHTGLHNWKWAGGMLRLYEEIGSWRTEPGTTAQSSQKLWKTEGGLRNPQEKHQIVCRRGNVWCWDVYVWGEFESETVLELPPEVSGVPP